MARHPANWATSPETVRASRMPEEKPGHDPRHHPSAPLGRGQIRGERDHDLSCDRRVPTAMEARPNTQILGARAHATRATTAASRRCAPPGSDVGAGRPTARQEQSGGVADLRRRDDQRGQARTAVEVVGHQVQHRLGVVQVGHHRAGRHGDEHHQSEAARCLGRRRFGAHLFRVTGRPGMRFRTRRVMPSIVGSATTGLARAALIRELAPGLPRSCSSPDGRLFSDVAAAPALGGDADQSGEDERDAGDDQPDAEDEREAR